MRLLDERDALWDKLAVCVASASSSYIMESVGAKRKEGAANRKPPAIFVFLESLRVVVHPLLGGLHPLVRVLVFRRMVVVVAERIMFIVVFICCLCEEKMIFLGVKVIPFCLHAFACLCVLWHAALLSLLKTHLTTGRSEFVSRHGLDFTEKTRKFFLFFF
jgi:hypothetical protein